MSDELGRLDREILADLYLSTEGMDFLTELIERFGSRFGGSREEWEAAQFIQERFREYGIERTRTESFVCPGWMRKSTQLSMTKPRERELDCIALPYCPPGEVEAPLVYLGDGHPDAYERNRDAIKGAIVMVTTATPRFYHRSMHRGEKLGRAIEAGAAGFIWMRGEPGGLPETGAARLGFYCEIPAISVSYEVGSELVRLAQRGELRLKIESTNENREVESRNVVAELPGKRHPDEVIVVGAHYDGHDISQAASDDGAGAAVLMEAARALARHQSKLDRTVQFVAFAQEEMGLFGSEHHAGAHGERTVFMLNLDGAGRGPDATFVLQGWPEGVPYFRRMLSGMYEGDVAVGDLIGLYSDMYPFAARGIPAAWLNSDKETSQAAPRGYGHTYWDSLDKLSPKPIQIDASRVARVLLRLATASDIPLARKRPEEMGRVLQHVGLDTVLRYERRPVPGEA